MTSSMKLAVLLREPSDAYSEEFAAAGWRCAFVPVLEFRSPPGEAAARLGDALARPQRYSGLVLTSRRAVEACPVEKLALWKDRPVYVVGEATARSVDSILTASSIGAESGDAERLAELIISKRPRDERRPLLFPCGNLARETLPKRLAEADVPLESIVAYETCEKDASLLAEELSSSLDDAEAVVFFSPSGVNAVLSALDAAQLRTSRSVAIGSTTAARMTQRGLIVHRVAATPTPRGVLDALNANIRK